MIIIFLFFSLLAGGCSSSKKVTGSTKAEVLFKQAQDFITRKRYLSAIERINVLRSQYPYSFYATPSELLMADIHFLQKDYIEAAASYLAFRDLHPRHKRMDYIIFKIAESYFKQMPSTFDRDLTSTKQAISYYRELLQKYPKSQHIADVEGRLKESENMVENKEKYIADFYFKVEKYQAARYRYYEILKRFKDNELKNHARLRIVKSSFQMEEYKKCLEDLKRFAPSFDEKVAREAEELASDCGAEIKRELESKGLTPLKS